MTQASFARFLLILAAVILVSALVRAPGSRATPIFALSVSTPHVSLSVSL